MKIIREIERNDLMDKFHNYISKLEILVEGNHMPDPVAGQEHPIGMATQILKSGTLTESFSEIDDVEIENTINSLNNIIKKILKLKNHRHDIYTYKYTDFESQK